MNPLNGSKSEGDAPAGQRAGSDEVFGQPPKVAREEEGVVERGSMAPVVADLPQGAAERSVQHEVDQGRVDGEQAVKIVPELCPAARVFLVGLFIVGVVWSVRWYCEVSGFLISFTSGHYSWFQIIVGEWPNV